MAYNRTPLADQQLTIDRVSTVEITSDTGDFGAAGASVYTSSVDAGGGTLTSPEETKGSSTGKNNKKLVFPLDLTAEKYFITFELYKYKRLSNAGSPQTIPGDSIVLPMPSNLAEKFGMNYTTTTLDPILGTMSDQGAFGGVLSNIAMAVNGANAYEAGKGAIAELQKIGKGGVKTLMADTGTAAALMVGRSIGGLGESAANILSRYQGVTLNPYAALQFNNPELRQHAFSFRMSPSTSQESEIIKRIIKTFKLAMHPSLNASKTLYNYPDICRVYFGDRQESKLYTIFDCFITGIGVNYAPQNTPAFFTSFNGELNPAEVTLEISLSEIRPLTREAIEDGKEDIK